MAFGEYCVAGSKEKHIERLQGSIISYMEAIHKCDAEWVKITRGLNKKLTAIEKELAGRTDDEKLVKAAAEIAKIRKKLEKIEKKHTPRWQQKKARKASTSAH